MHGAFIEGVDVMNLEIKEGQLTGNEALDDLVLTRPMSISDCAGAPHRHLATPDLLLQASVAKVVNTWMP